MDRASAQVYSVRGLVQSGWQRSESRLALNVTIPPNATAEIHIPIDGVASIAYENEHDVIHAYTGGRMKLDGGYASSRFRGSRFYGGIVGGDEPRGMMD